MIKDYNVIDVEHDTREVIQAKIDTLKEALKTGDVTMEEYEAEQHRVESALASHGLGYAFSW